MADEHTRIYRALVTVAETCGSIARSTLRSTYSEVFRGQRSDPVKRRDLRFIT